MAYQKVGTPRFYIDTIQWLKSIDFDFESWYHNYVFKDMNENGYGIIDSDHYMAQSYLTHPEIFAFEPEIQKDLNLDSTGNYKMLNVPVMSSGLTGEHIGRYVSVLNHNYGDMKSNLYWEVTQVEGLVDGEWTYNAGYTQEDSILNYAKFDMKNGSTIFEIAQFEAYQENFDPLNDDFCVGRIGLSNYNNGSIEGQLVGLAFGAVSYGIYYDMPVNPDLDLTMSIEYDGFTNIKTLSGHTITQANYQGSPWWYDKDGNKVEPWSVGSNDISQELSGSNPYYQGEKISNNIPNKRNGRRVWKLKFSYMSDKDLFASNYGSSTYLETDTDYNSLDLDTDIDNNNIYYYNIDNDDSFSAQVLNKISHGEKFIFQPDNTSNNLSDFAICVLDGDSFEMKRTAPNVYDIEMTIREVW